MNKVEIMLDKERKDLLHRAVTAVINSTLCQDMNQLLMPAYKALLEKIEKSDTKLVLQSSSSEFGRLIHALEALTDEFSIIKYPTHKEMKQYITAKRFAVLSDQTHYAGKTTKDFFVDRLRLARQYADGLYDDLFGKKNNQNMTGITLSLENQILNIYE